jgi:hypothetical protein
MKFFIENGMVEKDPVELARFLRHTPGLDKAKIGEYLGESFVHSSMEYLGWFDGLSDRAFLLLLFTVMPSSCL